MNKLFTLALAAGVLLAAGLPSALAAKPAKPADKKAEKKASPPAATDDQFKKLDTNGNGKLSLEEFQAMFDANTTGKPKKGSPDPFKLFSQLDADNSNSLSPAEFKALKPADLAAAPKKKKK